jgi:hypothetical protein
MTTTLDELAKQPAEVRAEQGALRAENKELRTENDEVRAWCHELEARLFALQASPRPASRSRQLPVMANMSPGIVQPDIPLPLQPMRNAATPLRGRSAPRALPVMPNARTEQQRDVTSGPEFQRLCGGR